MSLRPAANVKKDMPISSAKQNMVLHIMPFIPKSISKCSELRLMLIHDTIPSNSTLDESLSIAIKLPRQILWI